MVSLNNKTCFTQFFVKHGTNDSSYVKCLGKVFIPRSGESVYAEARGLSLARGICLAFRVSQSMKLLKHFYKVSVSKNFNLNWQKVK